MLPFHAAPLRVADTSPRHPHTDAYLAGLRDRIAQREKVPVLAAMIGGPVLGGLLGYAARVGAGLIVMTTHGRAGPHATRLGTIAGLMAAQSSIPVLFIRPDERPAPLEHATLFRRIFVPLDGTGIGESALPHAAAIGGLARVHYTLAHVIDPVERPASVTREVVLRGGEPRGTIDERAAEARLYLEEVSHQLRLNGCTADIAVRIHHEPPCELLRIAHETKSDLVALTTYGVGATSLALGGIADTLLASTTLPILLAPPNVP